MHQQNVTGGDSRRENFIECLIRLEYLPATAPAGDFRLSVKRQKCRCYAFRGDGILRYSPSRSTNYIVDTARFKLLRETSLNRVIAPEVGRANNVLRIIEPDDTVNDCGIATADKPAGHLYVGEVIIRAFCQGSSRLRPVDDRNTRKLDSLAGIVLLVIPLLNYPIVRKSSHPIMKYPEVLALALHSLHNPGVDIPLSLGNTHEIADVAAEQAVLIISVEHFQQRPRNGRHQRTPRPCIFLEIPADWDYNFVLNEYRLI